MLSMLSTLTNDNSTRNIHTLVYELLLNYSTKFRFPINPYTLFKQLYHNGHILTLNQLKDLGFEPEYLKNIFNHGFLLIARNPTEYFLFLNADNIRERSYRIAIAIAYIETGLARNEGITLLQDNDEEIFEYANCLLAPDILLESFGFTDQEHIMMSCFLPFANSLKKEKYLKQRKFSRVFKRKSVLEELLINNFYSSYYPEEKHGDKNEI